MTADAMLCMQNMKLEESPGSMRTRCRITSGEGNLRESATENIPPFSDGKGEKVRLPIEGLNVRAHRGLGDKAGRENPTGSKAK
jgi:hypothetical protein